MNTCLCCDSEVEAIPAIVAPFVRHRTRLPSETNTLLCKNCGFARSEFRLTKEQDERLYAGYRDELYTKEREFYEPGYTERFGNLNDARDYIPQIEDMLKNYLDISQLKILDIGGNDGANTPFLGRATIDILEISNVDPVNIQGVRVIHEPEPPYDLSILAHVLEHLADPESLLRMAAENSTYVYIELPDDPLYNFWHEHCNIFSIQSIEKLCNKVGLSVLHSQKMQTTLGPIIMVIAK